MSNVLRSGHGQFDEDTVRSAVTVSRAAFPAASALEAKPVRAAIDMARELFTNDIERRVEKSLQLIWWAGGGDPSEFPISVIDDMQLNPSDTRDFLSDLLRDRQTIEDPRFWERLADRLDFDMLVDVGDIPASENLNRLLQHLRTRLLLSHAVIDEHPEVLPLYGEFTWSLNDHFLQLNGPNWACRLTPHGNRFSHRRNEGSALPLRTAAERSAGLIVERAEIEEAARRVLLSRTGVRPEDYVGDSLSALTKGFLADSRLRSLTVQSAGNLVTVEFDRMMLSSEPDSPAHSMAYLAVQLLESLDVQDQQKLQAFLGI